MTLRELQEQAFAGAEQKGFHESLAWDRYGVLVRLCLIHTEVSEAAQAVKRHGIVTRQEIAEELADILIRLGDLAEGLGIDLSTAVQAKMAKNETRPYLYGTPDSA